MERCAKSRRLLLAPLPADVARSCPSTEGFVETLKNCTDAHETRAELGAAEVGNFDEPKLVKHQFRKRLGTRDEILALRGLRGNPQEQLDLIASLGFPEPRVVPARTLDRLGSLQRAKQEWKNMGGQPEHSHVAQVSGRLADWNKRNPLSMEVLEASTVSLREVMLCGATIGFTALFRMTDAGGDLPEPLSESTPRITAALSLFAQHAATAGEFSGAHPTPGMCGPHFLIPSLSAAVGDLDARRSAAAAMPLYVQCCHNVLTFGPAPDLDADALRGFPGETVDLETKQKEQEKAALSQGLGFPGPDQEALERCNKLWEAAERMAAVLPKKKLPRFRSLFPEPPGNLPPGTLPPGTLPPGNLPPGNLPPGNLPPGNLPRTSGLDQILG